MANELQNKIIKQIEYYFGDFNLPKDKFMQEQIKLEEGWIPLDILLKFERLSSLSKSTDVIVEAVKKSTNNIVEVNEENTKIRRSPENPVPEFNEERRKEVMQRTAYAKGFPLDETLDNILTYMNDHGTIESCIQRKYLDKATKEQNFKGSCFITFTTVDGCKKFLDAEDVKYLEKDLIRKWQADYIEEKRKEREEYKAKKGDKKDNAKQNGKQQKKIEFPKGAVIYFEGAGADSTLTREDIKAKIKEVGEVEVAFIDFKKGDENGHVRFGEENAAVEFVKKLTDGVLEMDNVKLDVRALEGDEEAKHLEKALASIAKNRQFNSKKKGSFGGGRNRNKRRLGHGDEDGPPAKK